MDVYLIGVDLGTQGTKAALFDEDMRMVATAFEASRLVSPKPGVVWQEADDLYASLVHVIRDLVEQTGINGNQIVSIGIDGQMAGIMGISSDGSATTYYDSWLDMRCGPYADRMNAEMGSRIIALSGGAASFTHGPKILWWKHEQPEKYAKTSCFVPPHAYLVCRMTGQDSENAYCDYTHLHLSNFADTERLCWSDELLASFGVESKKLPRIVSPFDVIGYTTVEFACLSGTVAGIPVVAGCGDTAAGTFGSGMFEPGMLLDIAGTASVLCGVVNRYAPDVEHATLTMMRSPIEGLFLPLAYINGAGLCIRWCRDLLHSTYDELSIEAGKVKPGSEGLIFIPHFSGRVLPNNPYLKGSFQGLDFVHSKGHLYRAVMESVAYEYAIFLSVMQELFDEHSFDCLISMGGGAQSPLFCQIKADVLGINVATFKMGETALIGSAVIAGVGVGFLPDYQTPIRNAMQPGQTYSYDATRYQEYLVPQRAYLCAVDSMTNYYMNAEKW